MSSNHIVHFNRLQMDANIKIQATVRLYSFHIEINFQYQVWVDVTNKLTRQFHMLSYNNSKLNIFYDYFASQFTCMGN